MRAFNAEDIKGVFKEIYNVMKQNADYLIELDGAMGDGDLGITMSTGFEAVANEIGKI